jgi:hypothetical protein
MKRGVIKTMMVAGALSLGLVMASPMGAARADSDVDIGIGLGGGYDPGPYYWPARQRISCREGARIVASAGFRRVQPFDCSGSEYGYRGFRRDNMYEITLRSSTGRIKDIDRIRRGGGYGDDDDGDYGGGYGGGYGDDYDDEY